VIALLVASWLSSAASVEGQIPPFEFSRPEMGVEVRMVLHEGSRREAEAAALAAFGRVRELNRIFSDYEPTSFVGQLSESAGSDRWHPAPREFQDVWRIASAINERSEGAFDVTCGPLSKLWRRARREGLLASPSDIEKARARSGRAVVEWSHDGKSVRLRVAGAGLDFGGIVKGFALDEAMAVLNQHAVRRALVQADGDILVGALPPGRTHWIVAIADVPPHVGIRTLELPADTAVSTSGDHSQHFESEGRRLSHILDPRCGEPTEREHFAVVVAPRSVWSDALATTACVLGRDLERLSDLAPDQHPRVLRGDAQSIFETTLEFPGTRRATPLPR
jgi:thiamine biosynthesis lipoprotein